MSWFSKSKKTGVVVTQDQIGGYRTLNCMWSGQTSQTYEVSEAGSGRHFALKILHPEHAHKADQRQLFFHEAEVGKQIGHPKIIKVLSVVRDPDNPFMVMEFFPSQNLKLRIIHKEEMIKEKGHDIIEQTAMALAFMHERGWVHRDVKPDNILVNSTGDVRLIDFALAQRLARPKRFRLFRRKGKVAGTRTYMSPEQIRGEPLDERADLYSLGVTIYEMLTGRPPFRAASPMDLLHKHIVEKPSTPKMFNPEVTDEMAALVLHMLAKKREDRPEDMHVFLQKFRNVRLFKSQPAAKKKTEQGL